MRFRGLLLLPMLSALLLLLGPTQAQGVNAKNLLKLARDAADSNDWAKAKQYADMALAEEGGYLDAYYMRAFANRQLGEKKKAEEDFKEVIRRDPAFLPTYGALADMYISDQEWDKAEKVFNDLGAQDDGAKWASYYRGVVAYERGDLPKAEKQWKDAVGKDVNFAQAIHNLGAVALAKREDTRALTYFQEALQKAPENPMYRFHVAWTLCKTKQIPKAQELLKRVMNENADNQGYWLLARALDQMTRGQLDSAVKVLDTVTRDHPELLDAWVLKARAQIELKRMEDARVSLSKAKELDPLFVEVSDLMAKLPPPPPPAPESKEPAPASAEGEQPAAQPPDPPAEAAPASKPAPPVRERKPL